MSEASAGSVVLEPSSISIRGYRFLGAEDDCDLRSFLGRTFSVQEVRSVDLNRRRRTGRIHHVEINDRVDFWRRLGRALRCNDAVQGADEFAMGQPGGSASDLFLGTPGPLQVSRVGRALTTFRARMDAPGRLRLWHPLLRRDRDIRFRLEEELASFPGVRSFRPDRLSRGLRVELDPDAAPELLLGDLERAWPRLLEGWTSPPAAPRLVFAGGLLTVSAAALVTPALQPVALAGIVLYGLPNFLAAIRQLFRRRVGVPAMRATRLVFFLLRGVLVRSSFMSTLTESWPAVGRDRTVASQRRLLAPYRRRPRVAWLVLEDGASIEVPVDRIEEGDLIRVRRGETVPADGTVEQGLIATADAAATASGPVDREPDDPVRAGELVLDGEALVRVARPARRSSAALIEAQLPHGPFARLPAIDEADRIAERNAKPALALAFTVLATRRMIRPAQGILQPDYVTGPRLSAELGAQQAFVEALRAGVLFRRPAALDRLADVETVVLDESAPLLEQRLEIGRIVSAGAPETELLAYAAAALHGSSSDTARALRARTEAVPAAVGVRRRAGIASYHDRSGHRIDVAAAAYLASAGFDDALPRGAAVPRRTIWVLRDGKRLGRIDFRHAPARPAREAIARLRVACGSSTRVLLLSGAGDRAVARLGAALDADLALGRLDPRQKAEAIRDLGGPSLWIGDGTLPNSAAAIAAADVRLSTAHPAEEEQADGILVAGLGAAAVARALASSYRATVRADYRIIYAANLAAVAGALGANLGVLPSGLVSNAGTALVYARRARALRRIERDQRRREQEALAAFAP